ncbi:MAG: benzoate/H(+) symporter BenE family transporter [Solirubrobacterales bacterium]|nr:benzoate/H(+) symporter BenE family transporter [Solirubrobacterales bacterium]
MTRSDAQPVIAGVVASVVGFAGSFTVVLAGLRAAGADRVQASSGLLILSVAMGLTGIASCWRSRIPLAIAWSTPRRRGSASGSRSSSSRWPRRTSRG